MPTKAKVQSWVRYKPKEVELLITKLAREGKNAAAIGLILRDTYGIPSTRKLCGKQITGILAEKRLAKQIPDDLNSLIRKSIQLRKHLEGNHKDVDATRSLDETEARIRTLERYFKRIGKLPKGWKFDPKRAGLYIE
ncbi:30S ribosomal protein S15 [Candidatus Woesearchaeota archaeon]|nr:30S ribosomal protein S15 [Candidatus Woesearchaeota archaeon]